MFWYQLLRPFSYIVISHPAKKMVDWYVPLGFTILMLVLLLPFRAHLNIWGGDGLILSIENLVQGLPGFFIAALAAIATFGKHSTLDKIIPKPTPTLKTLFNGAWLIMDLTRRRFLCLLFAYLTVLSILLSLVAACMRTVAGPARLLLPGYIVDWLSLIVTTGYLLFLFQLMVVTMWGLYYLGDRIHQPEPFDTAH